MVKKLLALLLSLAMMVSLAVPALAEYDDTDVVPVVEAEAVDVGGGRDEAALSLEAASSVSVLTRTMAMLDPYFDVYFEVFEWGSAVTALIIDMETSEVGGVFDKNAFEVSAVVTDPHGSVVLYDGPREVLNVYPSTVRAPGSPAVSGRFIVLELKYGYSPFINGAAYGSTVTGGNARMADLDYTITIGEIALDQYAIISPVIDKFALVQNPVEGFGNQNYRVYIPEGASNLPLVLWSHGGGENFNANGGGNEGAQLRANEGGAAWITDVPEAAVVLAPQRGTAAGAPGYSPEGIIAYIEYLIDEGIVNADRVYMAGPSAGGAETLRLLRDFPDVWAAAIPICSNFPGQNFTPEQVSAIVDVPIWFVHTDNDNPNNSLVGYNAIREAGSTVIRRSNFAAVPDGIRPTAWGTTPRFQLGSVWSSEGFLPNPDFVDEEGFAFEYYRDGHWSWIMVLNNVMPSDAPVTPQYTTAGSENDRFIDWMFAQSKEPPPLVQVDNLGVEGSVVYTYIPEFFHNYPRMLAPLYFVYADSGFASKQAAWNYINQTGIIDLAYNEENPGAIMIMNPVGDTWGPDDAEVYWELQDYLWFPEYMYGYDAVALHEEFIDVTTTPPAAIFNEAKARHGGQMGIRLSFLNRQYVIAEGSGATYFNNIKRTDDLINFRRLAGALLVGGEIDASVASNVPVPVYLAGSTQAAQNFYLALNDATVIDPIVDPLVPGRAYADDSVKGLQRVVIDNESTVLNRDLVELAYNAIFQRALRQPLSTRMWDNVNYTNSNRFGRAVLTTETFMLMERPVISEIGLTRTHILNQTINGDPSGNFWKWVPYEADPARPEYIPGKEFPLVISLHSDHAIYDAEANGWIGKAGAERFIVLGVTTHGTNPARTGNTDRSLASMIHMYNIDESRIYLTGFSGGANGSQTHVIQRHFALTVAAVGPIDPNRGGTGGNFNIAMIEHMADEVDLPYVYLPHLSQDSFANGPLFGWGWTPEHFHSTGPTFMGRNNANHMPGDIPNGLNGINSMLFFNNIPIIPEQDFDAFPIWGIERPGVVSEISRNGIEYLINDWQNDAGAPMVRLATSVANNHMKIVCHADVIWDYFKMFSRCTETGESIYHPGPQFDIIAEVREWGSAVTSVIIDLGEGESVAAADISAENFNVDGIHINPLNGNTIFNGARNIINAYVSQSNEFDLLAPAESGRYIVLELEFRFRMPGPGNHTNPMPGSSALVSSRWVNMDYSVSGVINGVEITAEMRDIVRPIYDDFTLENNPVEGFRNQNYRVYFPDDAEGPLPVVVWHHGGGESYGWNAAAQLGTEGAQLRANMGSVGWVMNAPEPVIVIAPQRGTATGAPGYSREGVSAYIEYLIEEGIADGRRIYMSGASMGGTESQWHAVLSPHLFAAVVPVALGGSVGVGFINAAQARVIADGNIPFWYSLSLTEGWPPGTTQYRVDNQRISVGLLQEAGATVHASEFTHVWGTELGSREDTPDWLPPTEPQGPPPVTPPWVNPECTAEHYPGHWGWILVANNEVHDDVHSDLSLPIMDWMFAQRRADATYDLVIEIKEWGSAVTAVVIDLGEGNSIAAEDVDTDAFSVHAIGRNPLNNNVIRSGARNIVNAFVSESGEFDLLAAAESGRYIVLEMQHGFDIPVSHGNAANARWADLEYTITVNEAVGALTTESTFVLNERIIPIYDDFALVPNPVEGFNQSYRVYIPEADGPLPLVLWNHGGGEGFNWNAAAQLGNEGAQLRANMGGVGWVMNAPEAAVVLAPQRGGAAAAPGYSIAGVIAYIEYLIDEGIVDSNRVYISGASAGAAETHQYMFRYPDMWAAANPTAMSSGTAAALTVAQAEQAATGGFPTWYTISLNETNPNRVPNTRVSQERLIAAGAVAFNSEFEIVFGRDPGFGPTDGPRYDGHWGWIMALNNEIHTDRLSDATTDLGNGEGLMDWMFAQTRASIDFYGTRPAELNALLAAGNVNLKTPGNYGIARGTTLEIPVGRTLFVTTVLNVRHDAELIINGSVVVLPGGRINNDGSGASGGTITIGPFGRLVNDGYIENVSGSTMVSSGSIINNGRFEVRALTTLDRATTSVTGGSVPLNIHRNAILLP